MNQMLILAAYDFAFFKSVFLCALALGLIVFIHELGHFQILYRVRLFRFETLQIQIR